MVTIKTDKSFTRLNLHAENGDELQVALNALFNWSMTDDTRDVSADTTFAQVRSNRKRFIHGLCEAKRSELRNQFNRSPKMSRVCVEVAHFLRDTVEIE